MFLKIAFVTTTRYDKHLTSFYKSVQNMPNFEVFVGLVHQMYQTYINIYRHIKCFIDTFEKREEQFNNKDLYTTNPVEDREYEIEVDKYGEDDSQYFV